MSSNIKLPRQIQSIIDEAVPSALKLYSELQNKEKSLTSINNHILANTLPRSIQLKLDLVIPKSVLEDEKNSEPANRSRKIFQDSLSNFQREAIVQMRTIAEFAVDTQKRLLFDFIARIDNDIIIFYYRLLLKLDSVKAEQFKTDIQPYPTVPADNRSEDVKEVLDFIASWRTAYSGGLRSKLAKDVENEIKQEKRVNSKEAAEDVIMGDNNNDLVRDLIRRELKPIKETVQRLNKVAVERSTSTGKQKDYRLNSKVSWQAPVSGQVDAKDAKRDRRKQREKGGDQHTYPARGRDKTPRSSTPEHELKPILKQSTSGPHPMRTRSGSSRSNRSRN